MSLTILTEATGGDTIDATSKAMQALAEKLGMGVSCRFNDILIYTWPGRAPNYAEDVYNIGLEYERLQSERKAEGDTE